MSMIDKKCFTIIGLIALTSMLAAQSQAIKALGTGSEDRAWSVCASYDGGYVVAGQTFGYNDGDAFIAKFDAEFNVEWSKVLSRATPATEIGLSVFQCQDSGYVLTGFSAGYADIYLAKFSKKGDFLWVKTIKQNQFYVAYGVIQSNDLGYVVTGCYDLGAYVIYQCIAKFSSSGGYQWCKVYSGLDAGSSLVTTSDGGYVTAGYTGYWEYSAGADDATIMKVDSLGEVVWARAFGGADYERAASVTRTLDNSYVAVGFTRSFGPGTPGGDNFIIAKVDSEGTFLWVKYCGLGGGDGATSVYATSDTGFVVVGGTSGYSPYNVLLAKFDAQGNYEYGYVIPADEVHAVTVTQDKGFAAAGVISGDVYIAKYDSTGTTCEGSTALPPPLVGLADCSITVFVPTITVASPNTTVPAFFVDDAVFSEYLICMNDILPPVIESTTVWHDTSFTGPYDVATKVTDNNAGVDEVRLYYRRDEDGDWNSLLMTGAQWYNGSIPGVGHADDTVRYYIWASDSAEPANIATDPDEAPDAFYWFIGGATAIAENENTPAQFRFSVASPARHHAVFSLSLPEKSRVSLRIYDVLGRLVSAPLSGLCAPGFYNIPFEPGTKGIYFYELEASILKMVKTGKVVVL